MKTSHGRTCFEYYKQVLQLLREIPQITVLVGTRMMAMTPTIIIYTVQLELNGLNAAAIKMFDFFLVKVMLE